MARFGRRRILIGAVVAIALLLAGAAVVLGGTRSGGDTASSVAEAPAFPGSASSREGAGGTAGSAVGAESAPSAGLTAPAPDQTPGVPVGGVDRALVRTAQLTVEVTDAAAAIRQVRTAASAVNATITEEQSGTSGGWLVLRVPADSLDRLMEDIAGLMTVTARSTQVVDATEQVVDLDARVTSQQASVARVRALLAQATSIGDIVAIESELSRREAELDSLTGRLNALRDQVALSTLSVDLRTPGGVTPADDGETPGFLDGLAAGWDGLRALGSAVGAVIGFVLPFVPVLAVLGGIGWLARRIVRGRRVPVPAGAGPAGRSGPGSEGES